MDKLGGFTQLWGTVRDKFGEFFGKFSGVADKAREFFGRYIPARKETPEEKEPDFLQPDASADTPLARTLNVFKTIGLWLFRLRKIFMAIPVVWLAVKLASYNLENLPEQVGINLQADGTYAQLIDRSAAVYGPLGLTAVCLLLMFFSRKARYPWAISFFTLLLPLLILLTNLYPQ